MSHVVRHLSLCSLLVCLAASQANASTLVGLDRQGIDLGLGVGNGAGVDLDAALASGTHLGVQAGTALGWEVPYYGVRVAQTLPWTTGAFKFGVMATAYQQLFPSPEPAVTGAGLGLALAYSFSPKWTLRASLGDVVLFYPAVAPNILAIFDPNTGVELGYRFTPQLEATFGLNGFEQALGVNYSF